MNLTEKQCSVAIHALRVAADQFDADEIDMRELGMGVAGTYGALSLADQFKRQAKESRELADYIEENQP